jgi:hypothetical protein
MGPDVFAQAEGVEAADARAQHSAQAITKTRIMSLREPETIAA